MVIRHGKLSLPNLRNTVIPNVVDEGKLRLDELHRGYRIAIKQTADGWLARITAARGPVIPVTAQATEAESEAICAGRAREAVDRYINYLAGNPSNEVIWESP